MQLVRWALARPWRAIALLIAVTLAAAPGLLRLELRTDGRSLVPAGDPTARFDAEVRRHFHLTDPVVVFLTTTHPDGIYNLETLTGVKRLSDALGALEGVEDVMSLASERRDRVYPGTLTFRPFLDPLPDTPETMGWLKSDVDAAGILTGTLVSADRRSTALVAGLGADVDRQALHERILAAVRPYESATDTILVVGAPVAESLLGTHLLDDLAVLLPLSFLAVAAVIWVACRRLWGTLLCFLEVGTCLVFTFGLMGWSGSPVYLTTAVLPVVLTSIGLADEIHIFWFYQGLAAEAPKEASRAGLACKTLEAMVRPVVVTSLTTAIGFLSFLSSPIGSVRSFGLFAAVGILFCLLFSLAVVPAFLVLLGPERLSRPRPGGAASTPWTVRFFTPLVGRRTLTVTTILLVSSLAGYGLRYLEVQDSWIDGFAPGSPFRQASERVNSELLGTHLLLAHLAAGEGAFLDPALLDAVGGFEAFARSRPEVGGVLGPYSHLTAVAYLWQGRKEERRAIPRDPRQVRRLLERFDLGRGAERRRQVLDDACERAVVTIFLQDANYRETASLMTALRQDAGRRLAPFGVELRFAGDVAVSQAMVGAVVRTQVFSLLFAVAGAFVCLCLFFRSLRMGLAAVAPVVFAILWVLGLMGFSGVALGVATSTFCAVTLGIGVDYSVHFLERYRQARAAGSSEAVRTALAEAGPAIVADTLAVGSGFGLLVVSQVPANAHLGLLVALALGAGSLLTLAGLGALLAEA